MLYKKEERKTEDVTFQSDKKEGRSRGVDLEEEKEQRKNMNIMLECVGKREKDWGRSVGG